MYYYNTPNKPRVHDYLEPLVNPKKGKRGYDTVYGPTYKHKKIMLGESELDFDIGGKTLTVENIKFNFTPGLLELIFKSYPKNYGAYDLNKYKEILNLTSVHRENANANLPILVTSSNKYNKIISKLFNSEHTTAGKGLSNWKDLHINHNIDYKYWTNPNILVNRLRLLIASANAGNNSHNNEIQEIIKELQNKNYIQ